MAQFEREYWQATVVFAPAPEVVLAEFGTLLGQTASLLPGANVQWVAGIGEPRARVDLGLGAVFAPTPDLLVGTSADGWVFQLSPQQMVVRHQQILRDGVRGIPAGDLPTRAAFSEAVVRAIPLLPERFQDAARRVQLVVSYALFTGEEYPASALTRFLKPETPQRAWPPPDDVDLCQAHQTLRFQTIAGRRYVWNDSYRIGNWFNDAGTIAANSAVVRVLDLKTAVPEEKQPPGAPGPSLSQLPRMSRGELDSFFGSTGPGLVLDAFRRGVPTDVAPAD